MRGRTGGFTLIEVIVVMVVITFLTLLITESLRNLSTSQSFTKGQARLGDVADRVVRGIERDATFSVRIFAADTDGLEYLDRLDVPVASFAPGSRMPMLTARGYFQKDVPGGDPETGNVLVIGKGLETSVVDLSPLADGSDLVRVDLLQVVCWHLVRTATGDLDLARWGSVPLVRYADLAQIQPESRRMEVAAKLYEQGARLAWDPSAKAAVAFYDISDTGWITPMSLAAKVPGEPAEAKRDLLRPLRMYVAPNASLASVDVPLYAVPDAGGFPGGFEVKLDGPPSGKLLLIRLVVGRGRPGQVKNFAVVTRFVSCRDA